MKAVLKFDLENADDRIDFEIYSKALKMWGLLFDLEQHYRSLVKYTPTDKENFVGEYEELRETYFDLKSSNGLGDFDIM